MKLIECPRDAMQGMKEFIPTAQKIEYINQLLKVGFDTIDFGSFVSPKAIPQLSDTTEVVKNLDLTNTKTKLLAIIANTRGAEDAAKFDEITYLGFPFSVSETFQKRNTNSTIEEALQTVQEIQNICIKNNKELVLYLSMAFGNPYEDEWSTDIVAHWAKKMIEMDIKIISLADTIGVSTPTTITYLFSYLIPQFKNIEWGAHLHTRADNWQEKIEAAYTSGCRRFDSALKGFGGCPMAKDELVGNLSTENLLLFCEQKEVRIHVNQNILNQAMAKADEIFTKI
jgi:hydroxymethylglutaryl-CoA lyase